MKFAVIPPLDSPELMRKGDFVFVLAQLYMRNAKYRNFVLNLQANGHFIILDNGAGDHDIVEQDELIAVVEELRPDEVIAPDFLFDSKKTIEGLNSFIKAMGEADLLGFTKIFFCPQGETKEEWIQAYEYGIIHPLVSTIGLSKIAVPYAFKGVKGDQLIAESRQEAYDYLKERGFIQKPIHLLGAGDPNEFSYYENDPLIRSTDSCFSCLAGMYGIEWCKGDFTRIATPKDYFDRNLEGLGYEIAVENIDYLRSKIH